MSRISPKIIDVDGNRIPTTDIRSAGRRTCNFGDELQVSGGIESPAYIPNKEGRFPTQLFTNVNNEKFKYVKQITNTK